MANNITKVWELMGINPETGTGTYKNRMGLGNAITRDNGIPLDLSSLHATYNDAVVYAATSSIAYVDQIIAAEGVVYVITATSQGKVKISSYRDSVTGKLISGDEKEYDVYLKRVGIVPSGDEKSVTVNGEGLIKIFGFDSAQAGAVGVKENGKLVWKTLEEIGAGDGNDNTTYTFTEKKVGDEVVGLVIKEYFNGQPAKGEDGNEKPAIEIALDVYTKTAADEKFLAKADYTPYDDTELAGRVSELEEAVAAIDYVDETELEDAIKDFATVEYVDGEIDKIEEAIGNLNHFKAEVVDSIDKVTEVGVLYLIKDATVSGVDKYNEYIVVNDEPVLIGDTTTDLSNYYNKTEIDQYKQTVTQAIATAKQEALTEVGNAGYALANQVVANGTFESFKETNTEAINAARSGAVADVAAVGYALANQVVANATFESFKETNTEAINKAKTDAIAEVEAKKYATEDSLNEYKELVNGKLDNIEAEAEKNIIEVVKVNGTALTPDANRAVNVEVPISITTMGGYTELDGRVTANATKLGTLETNLGTTNTNLTDARERLAALEEEVGTIEASRIDTLVGKVSTLEGAVGAHESAIVDLTAEDGRLAGLIGGNTTDISALKAKVDTGDKTVKTYVDETVLANKYDDAAIKKLISNEESRAKGEEGRIEGLVTSEAGRAAGEEARIEGLLSAEVDRAKAAEKANTEEIARVNAVLVAALENEDETALNSIKELAVWIEDHETEVLPVVTKNKEDISKLDGRVTVVENKVNIGDKTVTAYVAEQIAANAYTLPGATVAALGGIKSAADVDGKAAVNKVYVGSDSIAEIKAVSTDILVQGTMTLILDGGNSGYVPPVEE